MANIVFRLPSKQITYGYVEVSGTPEEFGIHSVADADAIGITYAHYVNQYLEGEVEGVRQATAINDSAQTAIPAPKKAPGKPVKGVSGVRQVRTVAEVMTDEDVDTEAEARAIIEKELGATVIDGPDIDGPVVDAVYAVGDTVTVGGIEFTKHGESPWDNPVEARPKPWENGAKPKIASIDW